jgi:hypothetical protein
MDVIFCVSVGFGCCRKEVDQRQEMHGFVLTVALCDLVAKYSPAAAV